MRYLVSWLLPTRLFVAILVCCGCSQDVGRVAVLRLAVTTSTRDSGLLEQLIPEFEQQHAVRVDVVGVGTGAALKLGESGDVEVVLVHSRVDEDQFMADGHGVRREDVMQNTFVLLGPKDDPVGVARLSPTEAMRAIANEEACLVSRMDESGTAKRERSLWGKDYEIPSWPAHIETGQGMGATLVIADQMQGYVLSDRGTYLKLKDQIQLVPLVANSPLLNNPYGVIAVNPNKDRRIQAALSDAFIDYLISPQTQQKIADYQLHGESLFRPMRLDGS